MKMKYSNKKLFICAISFLCGSIVLCTFSFLQKVYIGFNPLILKGYVVPFIFGGISGSIIGSYIIKEKELSARLKQRVEQLEGLLPICVVCKKIRKPGSDPKKMDSWVDVEVYFSQKTSSKFSHGICPECMEKLYGKKFKKP